MALSVDPRGKDANTEVLQKLPTPGLVLPTWQPPLCGSSSPEEVRAECRLKAARSRTVIT